ncbi:hypothetical protein JVU11DRAFT_10605 [Chiua virens]|nr:hypothetical protein JVU11DRAFT_10605 [Chiua virens]
MSQNSFTTPTAIIAHQSEIIQSALLDLDNQDPQVWGDMCRAIMPALHAISEVVLVGTVVPPIAITTAIEFKDLKGKLTTG